MNLSTCPSTHRWLQPTPRNLRLECRLARAGRLGDLTWPVVRDYVDEVVTVSEEDIVAAMRLCYERMKARVLGSRGRHCPEAYTVGLSASATALHRAGSEGHAWLRVLVAVCMSPDRLTMTTSHDHSYGRSDV